MTDEPVSEFRIVPSTPDGRFGSRVVLVEELGVLFLLELGSVGRAEYSATAFVGRETHMTPSEMSQSRISDSDHRE